MAAQERIWKAGPVKRLRIQKGDDGRCEVVVQAQNGTYTGGHAMLMGPSDVRVNDSHAWVETHGEVVLL